MLSSPPKMSPLKAADATANRVKDHSSAAIDTRNDLLKAIRDGKCFYAFWSSFFVTGNKAVLYVFLSPCLSLLSLYYLSLIGIYRRHLENSVFGALLFLRLRYQESSDVRL